jgi:hypothetical protein
MTRAERVADVLRDFQTEELIGELTRRKLAGDRLLDHLPGRQVPEIRGAIEGAELFAEAVGDGTLPMGVAEGTRCVGYARGVAEALAWVLGDAMSKDLHRVVEEED